MQIREFLLLFFLSIPSAIIIAVATSQYPNATIQNGAFAQSTSQKLDTIKTTFMDTITINVIPTPTITPFPTRIPLTTQSAENTNSSTPSNTEGEDSGDWGVAKKIADHTYTIKIAYDNGMGSPQDVVNALNAYRSTHGKGALSWDDRLGSYAQTRVETFKSLGTTDAHAGFENYITNEDGFSKLGFNNLGENSYYGGPLAGVKIIEWAFAQSPDHNANQLGDWSHVGVGANETAVNLVFGKN